MTATTPTTGLQSYCPEMGEKKPDAQIEAQLAHYGRHWFIRCHPSLPRLKGRGIEFREVETAETLAPGSRYVGWSAYKVTEAAFEKICQQYAVSSESLL